MEKVPGIIQDVLVPLDNYLEHEIAKCELFFYFKSNRVRGSLDNLLLDDMNNVKNPGNSLISLYLDGKSIYCIFM